MRTVHFTAAYLLNPSHPVTIYVIGAGGTGSQVLTCLARLDVTLKALGHPGLHVIVYDPDKVTEANLGRQLFSPSDLGINKAVCLATRINHFFGNCWEAIPAVYPVSGIEPNNVANIIITCTDNIASRLNLWEALTKFRSNNNYADFKTPFYWLDFGNSQSSGQVLLGTIMEKIQQPKSKQFKTKASLKVITEYTDFSTIKDEDSGPSCSLMEALEKQDLFINSILAQLGCNILWKLFRDGLIDYQGAYLNLDTMRVNPILLK